MRTSSPLLTLQSAERLQQFYGSGHWQSETIYTAVHRHAHDNPDRVAVRETGRVATFADVVDAADRLAAGLAAAGLRSGDRVMNWTASRVEVAVTLLACSRNRFVCVPGLHREQTGKQVAGIATRIGARCIVTESGFGAGHHELAGLSAATNAPLVVRLPAGSAVASGEGLSPEFATGPGDEPSRDPDSIVYLGFTSGSSGEPKAAMHSDNTLLAPVRALRADWEVASEDVVYSLSPLSHNLGFGALILALTGGSEFVVHDLPRGAGLGARLETTGATFLFGVPTHALDLLREQATNPSDLSRVRAFRVSGAPVPETVAVGLLELGVTPQSGYGMTEAGSHHYTRPADDRVIITTTSGRPYDGYEVAVFEPTHQSQLASGSIGEICARGPSLMLGYFADQSATEAAFTASGWFMTGDTGWVDDEGYIRITGRKKDVIIRGGVNIYPARIEQAAARHSGVRSAAVVRIPDLRLGEKACLVVVPLNSTAPTADDLLQHLEREGLELSHMPEYLALVEALPQLASGKLDKRALEAALACGDIAVEAIRFRSTDAQDAAC